METTQNPTAPRFTTVDLHASVARELRPKNTTVNPRYRVWDNETGRAYDESTSRKFATDTARDLNAGLYGPLA